METQIGNIGGKIINSGVDDRAAALVDAAASHVFVAGAEERDVLMRSMAQLASLLMALSATPKTLEVLPESARADVLCLACDLAMRAHSILEGERTTI